MYNQQSRVHKFYYEFKDLMSKKNDKKEKIEEFFKICKKDSKFFEMDDFLV